jgi:copper transport protein
MLGTLGAGAPASAGVRRELRERGQPVRRRLPRGRVPKGRTLLGLVVGWLLVGVIGAAPALAHATVISTDPADGTRLQAAPAQVTITFSEHVGLDVGYVHVVDNRGRRVEDGNATHPDNKGDMASVKLKSGLGDGGYIISYRVLSADSHPITGAVAFTVGDGPLVTANGAVSDSSGADPTVNALFTITRWASFAGLVLLGGIVFLTLAWPAGRGDRRARRIIWTGWGIAAGSTAASLLLQGSYASGDKITSVFSPDLLSATLGSTFGRMQSIRLIALGALAVLLIRLLRTENPLPEQIRARDEDLAAILGLVVLATYAASGHAVAGIQPTVAVLSDIGHLAAMSTWVGGLVLLVACLLPARKADELAVALPKFSRLAFGSVAVLAATGVYQAWREVGTLPALFDTGYGKLLSFKIGGFLLLVGLGNLGRLAVRRRYVLPVAHALASTGSTGGSTVDGPGGDEVEPSVVDGEAAESTSDGAVAVADGDPAQPRSSDGTVLRRLRRSVGLEIGIAAGVLALTSVLVAQAPARATYVKPYKATIQLPRGGSVGLVLSPAKVGTNTVELTTYNAKAQAYDPPGVTLEVRLDSEGIGPLPVKLEKTSTTGTYRSNAVSLPRPGKWTLTVRVQTSEFDAGVGFTEVSIS